MMYFLRWIGTYLTDLLAGGLPALLLFALLAPVRGRRLRRLGLRSSRKREVLLAVFWMYCGGIAMLTLLPSGFHWLEALRFGYPIRFFRRGTANFIPFLTLGESRLVLLGNILLFVPFGLAEALLWRGSTARRALVTGIFLSGCIECWQYFAVGRSFDIDDLLFNTLGALCGFWLWKLMRDRAPSLTGTFRVSPNPKNNPRNETTTWQP